MIVSLIKENTMQESNKVRPDGFKVGDQVWCLVYGKGKVGDIVKDDLNYPMEVLFDSGNANWYTKEGRFSVEGNHTLFFSEPKIEASVTRPFVPTLVGKRVVVLEYACYPQVFVVTWEDESMFGNDVYKCIKSNSTVYEVSSENLLTSKK